MPNDLAHNRRGYNWLAS